MKDQPIMKFYEEDTGGASGSETNFAAAAGGVFDVEEPTTTETEETPVVKETVETPPTLTAKEIADAVREGVRPAEQPKEYTQAELDKIFKVWEPDEGLVVKLMAGGAESIAALKLMREGLAGQFGQLIQYQLQVMKSELEAKYSPALTYAQEARAEKECEVFFKEFEDLRDHPMQVDIAYKSLLGEGKSFPTLKEAQKALADRARQLIPNGNGSGTTQPSGTRTTTATTTKAKPAQLSGGGGAGGSGGGSATPNVFQEIFGPH